VERRQRQRRSTGRRAPQTGAIVADNSERRCGAGLCGARLACRRCSYSLRGR
jgi:hypothetical protein